MPEKPAVLTASLGPGIATVTGRLKGRPVAVINTAAMHDVLLRTQAAWSLTCLGLDAGHILGALHGVRR